MKKLIFLLLLLLLTPVFSDINVGIGAANGIQISQQGQIYLITVPSNVNQPLTFIVNNTDQTGYNVNIDVSGNLPILLQYMGNYLGSGTTFTSSGFTIYSNSVNNVLLSLLNPQPGNYYTVVSFKFTNLTNSSQIVKTQSFTMYITVIQQTTTQQPQQTQQTQQTQPIVNETNCLEPLRTVIKKTVSPTDVIDITTGIYNRCRNTTIKVLDVDIEGLPPIAARIKDASLGSLLPGQAQYFTVTVNASAIKSDQASFEIIYIAQNTQTNELERETTQVTIYVFGQTQQPQTQTPQQPQYVQPPAGTYQLNVDYDTSSGYLVIKGVYYVYNNTKIYVPGISVQVMYGGSTTQYLYPIKLQPGETYCISAVDPKQILLPYFNCFTVPKAQLCYSLDTTPQTYNNVQYFPMGSKFSIVKVYDCNTLKDILEYTILFDNSITKNTTFNVDDKIHTIVIKANGYADTQITYTGYIPVKLESELPYEPGNYTFILSGTLADQATLKIQNATTLDIIYQGVGRVHKVSLGPGNYKLVISAPLQDEITKTFYIIEPKPPEEPKPLMQQIFEYVKTFGFYALIVFVIFTILAIAIYYKVKGKAISEAVQEVIEQTKK